MAASACLTSSLTVWPLSGQIASADARADRQAVAVDDERLGERVPDAPLRGAHLLVVVDVSEDDRELVPTEPGDVVVFAADRAQARARLAYQIVAGLVAVEIVDLLEAVEVDEQQAHPAAVGADPGEGAVDPLPESHPVQQPGQSVMAGLVAQLVDQLAVLDRGRGERRHAREALEQVAVRAQSLRPLGDGHGEDPQELVPGDDRHDRQRDHVERAHQLSDEPVVGSRFKEVRLGLGEHALQVRRVLGCDRQLPQAGRLLGRASPCRQGSQAPLVAIPQPDGHAVAVDDFRGGRREALGDLEAGAGLGEGMRERQQRAHLFVAMRGLLQRERHVEHRGGVLGVEAEHLPVLGEELDRVGITRDQMTVAAPAGDDVDDQRRFAQRGIAGERRASERVRVPVVDTPAVDLQLGVRVGAYCEDVAGGAHGVGRALDHASQHRLDVLGRDQVAGDRVDAVQPLGHRQQLGLHRGDALLRVGGHRRLLRIPRDRVQAPGVAARLAFALLHPREGQSEDDRSARQQSGRPVAVDGQAREALAGLRPEHGAAGADLDRLELGGGAELGGRLRDGLQDRLHRAQRAQQRGDLLAGVLADHLLAHPSCEGGVAGDLHSGSQQCARLVLGDPVVEVFEVRGLAPARGLLEQLRDGGVAPCATHELQRDGAHRAGDVPIVVVLRLCECRLRVHAGAIGEKRPSLERSGACAAQWLKAPTLPRVRRRCGAGGRASSGSSRSPSWPAGSGRAR